MKRFKIKWKRILTLTLVGFTVAACAHYSKNLPFEDPPSAITYDFSRIDLAAELYDETVFESASFDVLAQKATRPFLIINATNLYQGARFEFTDPQFRYLGSDIGSYPVARAVAASSAFPFLLSPISLVNYAKPQGYEIPEADQDALEDYGINKRSYYASYNNYIYAEPDGQTNHPYLHLMDGGLADNIGLRAIYDLYVRGDIRRKINSGEIKRFLAIVVNSKTDNPADIDEEESPPGLMTVGYKTATLSLDNYTFETIEMFKFTNYQQYPITKKKRNGGTLAHATFGCRDCICTDPRRSCDGRQHYYRNHPPGARSSLQGVTGNAGTAL